ncbi:MAG: tetratricopeptide repeat protein [Cyanobacteria bacterium TGS_CYA1]|nr:tetratricopeptide repeat protein [Cyanobacteria bacterium TGS_CYA1]
MLFKRLLSAIMMNLMVISGLPAMALDKPISLSDPKSLRQSAFESYLQGNYDKAKVYYEQAIDQTQKSHGPNSPFLADLYFELGTISLELSKFTVASHYLPLAVEKKPNSLQARLKLVELDMLTGKEEDARVQLDAAQKAHPKSPEVQAAVVKWMIKESRKARREEGNPQKEQMLAMASVSGSYYLHKLQEPKTQPAHSQASSAKSGKVAAHQNSQPHKSSMTEGLSRFAAPVSEKPPEPKAKEPVSPPPVKVETPPPQKEDMKENPVQSALSLKSRVFQQPKKVEEKKTPPPVVTAKAPPKPATKPPKKEKPKPKAQPPVVAAAKPAKVAKAAPAKHVERAQPQQMAPMGGMDMSMMMPAMPVQMPPVGKKGKKGGLVPPPPPMIPTYPGSMYPSMMQPQARLETKARVQEEPKRKSKAAPVEQAGEAPANSEDPEFILEWASVKKKNKGKAQPKENKDE